VLGLAERGAPAGALEGLAVEGDGCPEARRVVGALARAHVRRQREAAPLRQLLQLVLVHPSYLVALLHDTSPTYSQLIDLLLLLSLTRSWRSSWWRMLARQRDRESEEELEGCVRVWLLKWWWRALCTVCVECSLSICIYSLEKQRREKGTMRLAGDGRRHLLVLMRHLWCFVSLLDRSHLPRAGQT
jgi:hypothetical protein